jgi:mono/diheme cytochrome c family protein
MTLLKSLTAVTGSIFLVTLFACSPEHTAPLTYSPAGPVAAEQQRPGDPEKGYQALVNNAYISCGTPYSVYRQTAGTADPAYLLKGREGRNAELPYMLTSHTTDAGVELVVSNCLACHAGFFNDKLIVGLGNESADWTNDLTVTAESAGAYIEDDKEAAEWRHWADRMAAIAPYSLTDTIGVNPANNLTLALIAHHDPKTLAWSQQPLIEPPPEKPLPVSVPPWWRMQKKNALFYSTEGRGDHARFMMTAALFCTDSVEEARAIDEYAPDLRAFLESLQPPDYPFTIDQAKAAQGRTVFENTCSRCHGTYGANGSYPNLVLGLDEIGTDPELARSGMEDAERFIRWYNESFFGELARAAPAPGYIAPPLDGVWATAPYLHNGSVPTIETLLNSNRRPQFWTRSFDSTDYDKQALGWNYTALEHGKAGADDRNERKRIYDTTLRGYSNQGHIFGDHLSDAERSVVLEYLKTL